MPGGVLRNSRQRVARSAHPLWGLLLLAMSARCDDQPPSVRAEQPSSVFASSCVTHETASEPPELVQVQTRQPFPPERQTLQTSAPSVVHELPEVAWHPAELSRSPVPVSLRVEKASRSNASKSNASKSNENPSSEKPPSDSTRSVQPRSAFASSCVTQSTVSPASPDLHVHSRQPVPLLRQALQIAAPLVLQVVPLAAAQLVLASVS